LRILALRLDEASAKRYRAELIGADSSIDDFVGTGLTVEAPAISALDERRGKWPLLRTDDERSAVLVW
jgi:hypothetical protein